MKYRVIFIFKLFSTILAVHFTTIYRIFVGFDHLWNISWYTKSFKHSLSHIIPRNCIVHLYAMHFSHYVLVTNTIFTIFLCSLLLYQCLTCFSHYFPLFSYFRILLRIPPVIFVKVNGMSFPLFYSFTFSYSVERPRFQWQ